VLKNPWPDTHSGGEWRDTRPSNNGHVHHRDSFTAMWDGRSTRADTSQPIIFNDMDHWCLASLRRAQKPGNPRAGSEGSGDSFGFDPRVLFFYRNDRRDRLTRLDGKPSVTHGVGHRCIAGRRFACTNLVAMSACKVALSSIPRTAPVSARMQASKWISGTRN
jgi:hypothetical protein